MENNLNKEVYTDYTSPTELQINLDIDPSSTKEDIVARFKEVSYNLLKNFVIRKSETLFYRIIELECYFFSKNHEDLITYQRDADAGEWFFHPSGVDICFKSSCSLRDDYKVSEYNEKTYFGGILIRSLEKIENKKHSFIMGAPRLCCEELFNQFSAFKPNEGISKFCFPFITYEPTNPGVKMHLCPRHFKFGITESEKYDRIIEYNWADDICKVSETDFRDYLKKNYRFYDSEGIERYDNWKPENGKKKSYNGRPPKIENTKPNSSC